MAKFCERCGVGKATYKRQGLDKFGNMCECDLCETCYFETSAQGWTTTKTRGIVSWQKSSGQCAFCGAIGEVTQMSYKDPSGATKMYSVCDACQKTLGHNPDNDRVNSRVDGGWTRLLKGISICFAVLSTIAGAFLGGAVVGAIDSDLVFFGAIIGIIVGFLIGIVSISFIMVICEISDTLKANNTELKKIYIELTRR